MYKVTQEATSMYEGWNGLGTVCKEPCSSEIVGDDGAEILFVISLQSNGGEIKPGRLQFCSDQDVPSLYMFACVERGSKY